jgi:hypothetical protein
VRGAEALILLKEVSKMEYKYMDAMIANTDGETKRELTNIMISGMILYFTSRQFEKFAMKQVRTRKVSTNIFKSMWCLKKMTTVHDQYI